MVAEARRISRKAKRLGLLAVHSVAAQRQEEEVLAVGEEDEDHLHAGRMRLSGIRKPMPAPARKPGPASEADAVIKRRFFFSMCCSIGAAGFRPSS